MEITKNIYKNKSMNIIAKKNLRVVLCNQRGKASKSNIRQNNMYAPENAYTSSMYTRIQADYAINDETMEGSLQGYVRSEHIIDPPLNKHLIEQR